jgi:hypothetical protein
MIIFFDIETISSFKKENRDDSIKSTEFFLLKEKYQEKLNFIPEFNKILCISIGFINN